MGIAEMRAAALQDKGGKKPAAPNETYTVTVEQLASLQENGSVTLDGGCTLELAEPDSDAAEEETE